MEQLTTEKIYFIPGDLVTIRHNLTNKPTMLVKSKETKTIRGDDSFKGMRCIWFTANGELQEAVFSTKDLQHVDSKNK